jgi:hypothetical protein
MGRGGAAGSWLARPVIVAAAAAALLLAACGGPGNDVGGAAGSCAAGSPPGYTQAARLVFTGTMLPGPAASVSGGSVLLSPARVRVARYLKGSGPGVVSVETGVTRAGDGVSIGEDGIQPQAGQRWTIYTASGSMPYETSICQGSFQS